MKTASAFPGFSAPAAGPEAPLDMLGACHTRVEKQCRTLERLLPHLHQHGSDTAAQQAAGNVLRYFNTAAVHHHADEEEDVFPALREAAQATEAAEPVERLTRQLCEEHRSFEAQWPALRTVLEAVAQGQPAQLDAKALSSFVQSYRRHIACEDTELIALARQLLDPATLTRIGRAMAQRRGLAMPAGAQEGV